LVNDLVTTGIETGRLIDLGKPATLWWSSERPKT